MSSLFSESLAAQGLNLQFVFDLESMPEKILLSLSEYNTRESGFRQLLLLGHGGTLLWQCLKDSAYTSADPIDDFTIRTIRQYFADDHPQRKFRIIYPGLARIGLQTLGTLAGWHHDSPFMVGVNLQWGSWYAYRAVVLADTDFPPSQVTETSHPCSACDSKICIRSCPVHAVQPGHFDIQKCIEYRKLPSSECQRQCLARNSCPVATEHRYSAEQIAYHYQRSWQVITKYY